MARLTLKFAFANLDDVEEYLKTYEGITNISYEQSVLDIEYDDKQVDCFIIMKALELFDAGCENSLYYFDKHESNTKVYEFHIKDICCDFCYYDMINELFYINGITKFDNDYLDITDPGLNVNMTCEYNPKIITPEELKQIEYKL
jgi:copper chaperone CopZ